MGLYLGKNRFRDTGILSSHISGATTVERAVEGSSVVLANLIFILPAPLVPGWDGEAKGPSCACISQMKLRKSEQHSTMQRAWVSRS